MERRMAPAFMAEHSESQKGTKAGNCRLRGLSNHVAHMNIANVNERPEQHVRAERERESQRRC
jgi:hypothetical protein